MTPLKLAHAIGALDAQEEFTKVALPGAQWAHGALKKMVMGGGEAAANPQLAGQIWGGLQGAGRGAMMGGGTGAAMGAITSDSGERLQGALQGGLAGGLLGGIGGGAAGAYGGGKAIAGMNSVRQKGLFNRPGQISRQRNTGQGNRERISGGTRGKAYNEAQGQFNTGKAESMGGMNATAIGGAGVAGGAVGGLIGRQEAPEHWYSPIQRGARSAMGALGM